MNFRDMDPEKRRKISSLGGTAKNEAEKKTKKFEDLVGRMLNAKVPIEGNIEETMRIAGKQIGSPVSALEAIIGVNIVNAMNGDLKSAYFVIDAAGYTAKTRERKAHAKLMESTANLAVPDTCAASTERPPIEEIMREAERMGLYEGPIE